MARPTIRVLALLELLQRHGRISGAELARKLDVDRRTVRRYISTLEELGIPITAEQGRDGGYLLVAGFKLPPMMFTDDEALALAVGLLAARGLGLAGAAPAVASAQAKLERVMPESLRRRVSAVDETVTLDLTRSTVPDDNAALAALSAAAQTRTRVHLGYRSQRGETERDLDPYALAYRGGCWYVVGFCHLRQGLRSFRLDRVAAVQPLATRFIRPPDFDVLAHMTHALATLPRRYSPEVLLATDLDTARRALFPAAGVLECTPDGVLLRAQADDLHWFARELARLPFGFEIRQPAELRDVLAEVARQLLARAGRGPDHGILEDSMNDPSDPKAPSESEEDAWDFAGARRHHLQQGLRMTPAERLRWLEETVDEMRRLQGLARQGRPIDESQG